MGNNRCVRSIMVMALTSILVSGCDTGATQTEGSGSTGPSESSAPTASDVVSTDSNPELEAESQPKHEPDSEPKGADRPWLVYQVPIQEAFVGAYREFGTFELVDGCAVFNNEHDQTSYLVAVFEGGGRPFDEGRAIQLPRYRVTFGSGIRYRVAGWPNGVPDAEFLDDMPPNCPIEQRSSQVEGLPEGSSLWSTTRTDRILLLDPATNDYIVLSREISRAGDRSPSGTRGG